MTSLVNNNLSNRLDTMATAQQSLMSDETVSNGTLDELGTQLMDQIRGLIPQSRSGGSESGGSSGRQDIFSGVFSHYGGGTGNVPGNMPLLRMMNPAGTYEPPPQPDDAEYWTSLGYE